ncbi:MAG: hypothetical protein LBC79_03750, partial [Deltaproteobacteria bacterium]|jgi:hypothetical protein|nr:hypothetical protein [Deltaproteobacteria bacterium]
VAGFADPVNFIVPGSIGAKATTIGGALRNAALGGAAGNVAADALIIPWANSHGEDLGFAELAKDAIMGAVIGSVFGAAGYGFARWRNRRREAALQRDMAAAARAGLEHQASHAPFEAAGRDRFFDMQDVEFQWLDRVRHERTHAPFEETGRDRFLDMQEGEMREAGDRAREAAEHAESDGEMLAWEDADGLLPGADAGGAGGEAPHAWWEAEEARQDYVDNELARLGDEAADAAVRHERRLDLTDGYIRQLEHAGYSRRDAQAYGLIHAAHAEVMAPLFGQTPEAFLRDRLAGFEAMAPREFEGLRYLEDLWESRALDQQAADMGITPGMSRARRRRLVQPEFAYAYGQVNPEAFIKDYGKDAYNRLRREFGPGFFAKKGEGFGLDELAQSFSYAERGGYEAAAHAQAWGDDFAQAVMLPHDEVLRGYAGGAYFQTAWHGSPYRFDKFSLYHMGSGEGAQAFGWGMYFAGEKSVAEHYRQRLAADQAEKLEGTRFAGRTALDWYSWWQNQTYGVSSEKARGIYDRMAMLEDLMLRWNYKEALAGGDHYAPDAVQWFKKTFGGKVETPGQLYRVDIPENHELLAWDKPLSEQPERIQAEIRRDDLDRETLAYHERINSPLAPDKITGADIYGYLCARFERHYKERAQEIASKYLGQLGVKGIRYLDEVSRHAGEGTYNFVIFDDKAVKILETYYQRRMDSPRGAIRRLDDGRFLVGLFKKADASTVIHESGHFFLENLREAAGIEHSPAWVKESWATLQRVYGFEGNPQGEAWRPVTERFAREFEAYAREGKAPAPELRHAFERFHEWLAKIYRNVKKLLGDEALTPEVRDVFDRLLASEADREFARHARSLDEARAHLTGRDRVNAGRLVDLVLSDIDADRPLDVREHARRLGMEEPPYLPEGNPRESGMPEPDWTPEPPGREFSGPPAPEEFAGAADRVAGGKAPEEVWLDAELQRLDRERRLRPEERARLEEHAADRERLDREEEGLLSSLGCIMGVV